MTQKIIVYHASYGCATGCCGHIVKLGDEEDFEFAHADDSTEEEKKAFAEQLIRRNYGEEHVKDLDWDNCIIMRYGC